MYFEMYIENDIFSILYFSGCIVINFSIYAFGEIVQLLQDIKDGIRKSRKRNSDNRNDLPYI